MAKAEAFIGFPAGDKGEYVHESPSMLDLLLFADITASFERAYEFAFNRSRLNTFGEHEVQDLQVFMEGTARIGGISSGGEQHQFMTPDGYCRTVADAALARWKLEWVGDDSATFTTRDLAESFFRRPYMNRASRFCRPHQTNNRDGDGHRC